MDIYNDLDLTLLAKTNQQNGQALFWPIFIFNINPEAHQNAKLMKF